MCEYLAVTSWRWASVVAAAVLTVPVAMAAGAGTAAAQPCPDVALVFARGTGEPPGIGRVGQALADRLASQLGGRSLGTYAVNYPASVNFLTTAAGAADAAGHIAGLVVECPTTQVVLGGFSQGAAVVSMLAGVAPLGRLVGGIGSAPPLPPGSADRIGAVAVFGNPAARFGTPLSSAGLFAGRAIDLCSNGDPICVEGGRDRAAHNVYESPPYIDRAAGFVAALI